MRYGGPDISHKLINRKHRRRSHNPTATATQRKHNHNGSEGREMFKMKGAGQVVDVDQTSSCLSFWSVTVQVLGAAKKEEHTCTVKKTQMDKHRFIRWLVWLVFTNDGSLDHVEKKKRQQEVTLLASVSTLAVTHFRWDCVFPSWVVSVSIGPWLAWSILIIIRDNKSKSTLRAFCSAFWTINQVNDAWGRRL